MNLIQYQAECQNTKSDKFFGERVSKFFLANAIVAAVDALQRLDAIKKSLFYGKNSEHFPAVNAQFLDDVEDCNTLQVHNLHDYPQPGLDILHGVIGKATEAAELLEALKRAIIDNQPLDAINIIEEVGDGFWYDAIILQALNVDFHEAARINNAKLKRRFPNKFTTDDAITRDLTAERETLETSENQALEIPAFLRRPVESNGAMLTRLGTDGDLWAQEFVSRLNDKQLPLDVDTMRAWFANAIEAGRTGQVR